MLSSSEIIDLKYKNRTATLLINEVFPEDEGEYTCVATNSIGSDTTSCKLTVKGKSGPTYIISKYVKQKYIKYTDVNVSLIYFNSILYFFLGSV